MALATALFGAIALLFLVPPPPSAEGAVKVNLCQSVGSGAGQCSGARGAAANFASGEIYVVERSNHRVSVFKSDGEFVFAFGWGVDTGAAALEKCTTASGCQAGIAGSGAGQFNLPSRIAIDNTGGPEQGKVYVGTDSFRVQKFKADGSFELAFGSGAEGAEGECELSATTDPLAVGPGGNVFVADNAGSEPNFTDRVQKWSPAGACLGETVLLKGNFEIASLVVDAAEDAFVAVDRLAVLELRKYDLGAPESKLCDLDPGIETRALTFDSVGHLFAAQRERRDKAKTLSEFQVITEYDVSSCPPTKHVRRFGYGSIQSNVAGLAALHTADGDVFASEESGGLKVPYVPIPPAGPIVAPPSLEAPEATIGNAKATVKLEVNPEGKETTVKVQYVDQKGFEEQGESFEGPNTKETEAKPLGMAAGAFRVNGTEFLLGCPVASKELIEEGKCLVPKTKYHWRVVATNADNPTGAGEAATVEGPDFETREPLEIEELWASGVGTDSARLSAVVNPLGIPASAYFEYVTDAQFKATGFEGASKAPAEAELDFGSGEAGVKRSVSLVLDPATTYHFRLSATDALIEGRRLSEAETFRTFAVQGPRLCPANEAFRIGPAALLPDCRAYEMVSPLDKENGDIVVLDQLGTNQPAVLNQSATSGERLTYGSYRAFGDAKSAPNTSQYLATRHPLGEDQEGWQTHSITPAAGKSIVGGADFDFDFKAFSDDLCNGWIVPAFEPPLTEDAIPLYKNLYRRSDELCGAEAFEALSPAKPETIKAASYLIEVQGLSADGSVVAFGANDSLEGSGAPSQPPGCAVDGSNCQLRVYLKGPGQGPRYACILPGGAGASACSAGTGNEKQLFALSRSANLQNALSADGKRIFWTAANAEGPIYLRENPLSEEPECSGATSPCTIPVSEEAEEETGQDSHFWAAAADGSVAIFSSGGVLDDRLYEFNVDTETTTLIAKGFEGVLGASEDAARLYFASTEALAPGAAAGEPNLYLREAGVGVRFIATLADSDVDLSPLVGSSSATGTEPYLHNSRVSPDGLHAAFMSEAPLTGYDNTDASSPVQCGKAKGICDNEVFLYDAAAKGGAGELLCVSCNPSGGRPVGIEVSATAIAARLPVFQTALYPGRLLAEDGNRLFFESQDPLAARDSNGRFDVYQWERAGTGDCAEEAASFSAAAGGCVDLISSGQSSRDSNFIDASPSGQDVFFATLEGLLPPDYGLVDIYDARAGGGFPVPPPVPPECEAEDCQDPPPAPALSTPPTADTAGPGNLVEGPKKKPKCPKGKHRVTKNGKSSCVKNKPKNKKGKAKKRAAPR